MLVYIHGFNSSPASNTYHKLKALFADAQALEYPSEGLFADNMTLLCQQVELLKAAATTPLVFVGSSLGGFYTSQVAPLFSANCMLINPAIRPAQSLRQFLGRNTYFHSGRHWEFTETICNSYQNFCDRRAAPIERLVVIGRNDTTLDPEEGRQYWQNHAIIHETDDAHSIESIDAVMQASLNRWLHLG
ncbi:MAG: hypothetical protein F8N36_13475 [Desulfovibrio sp.]|uniref:YqiA/YcfP family alpha/beta fold hydrolase n=1 Tax=Desulfovibrio sp. TaxID=885 RepID=UPI00135EF277|nr:YqiA/YcfP family alpha/beta fold hydrolase [Desulfovibrio sp.]MTJ93849.1 hypothetical protein [Desulfovibrio sp.]